MSTIRPCVGISACLLGEPVRYDGRDKRHTFLVETLGPHVEWCPICPEAGAGMGIPREPVFLRQGTQQNEMIGWESHRDYTPAMMEWIDQQLERWRALSLDGVILKSKSPSCGLAGVDVFDTEGEVVEAGRGLFAEALCAVESVPFVRSEKGLDDVEEQEHFLTQIFTHARWEAWQKEGQTAAQLQAFHASHKMLFLSYDQSCYRKMGPLVAQWKQRGMEETCHAYAKLMSQALMTPPQKGDHVNTVMHLFGMMKRAVPVPVRKRLEQQLRDYTDGTLALYVLREALKEVIEGHDVMPWLKQQVYLSPHPVALSWS